MGIVSVEELWQGRTGKSAESGRSYRRIYRVMADNRAESIINVGNATGIPRPGDTYPGDLLAFAGEAQVDQHSQSPYAFLVTIEYSTAKDRDPNPLNDEPAISWGTEQFQMIATQDRDGNGIVNSAGDPFDPPLEMDDSRRVVTIVANVADIPAISSWLLDYQDAVNTDDIVIDDMSILAGKAKMQRVSIGPKTYARNNVAFREVTLEIHLRRDGWALQPLDAGFREKSDSAGGTGTGTSTGTGTGSGGRVNITNSDGSFPPAPVLLDGNGRALDDPSASSAVFLTFDVYKERTFASLPGID